MEVCTPFCIPSFELFILWPLGICDLGRDKALERIEERSRTRPNLKVPSRNLLGGTQEKPWKILNQDDRPLDLI
jgi:hypothetical protein